MGKGCRSQSCAVGTTGNCNWFVVESMLLRSNQRMELETIESMTERRRNAACERFESYGNS